MLRIWKILMSCILQSNPVIIFEHKGLSLGKGSGGWNGKMPWTGEDYIYHSERQNCSRMLLMKNCFRRVAYYNNLRNRSSLGIKCFKEISGMCWDSWFAYIESSWWRAWLLISKTPRKCIKLTRKVLNSFAESLTGKFQISFKYLDALGSRWLVPWMFQLYLKTPDKGVWNASECRKGFRK